MQTVFEKPEPARTPQEHVQRINSNGSEPDKRGTPEGVAPGDVEKPRGAR